MPLTIPTLDDRDYPQIVREALARIPVHNPEWTNFNDSDPGVTLVQLFAFMAESLLYRANQIPERNRRKFLQLLGISLRPATAAHGFVTIQNVRGPLETTVGDANLEIRAGAAPFRTTRALLVLPIEARVFYKRELPASATSEEAAERDALRGFYADLLAEDDAGQVGVPIYYETVPFPPPAPDGSLPVVDLVGDTADGCLWVALLARPGEKDLDSVRKVIAGKFLTLGVVPGTDADGMVFMPGEETSRTVHKASAPGGAASVQEPTARAIWEIANPGDPASKYGPPHEVRATGDILAEAGLVELELPGGAGPDTWRNLEPAEEGTGDYPPSLADTDLADRVITWVRLRVRAEGGTARALVSWVGINAATVIQRANVTGEALGTGTGEPDQRFTLANRPVLPDTLRLVVNGEPWAQIDDLLAADPEVPVEDPHRPLFQPPSSNGASATSGVKVFTLDPESGEVRFGDGAHGMRPPRGAVITASYAYGGGRQGNVNPGAINRSPELPAGFTVTNPIRTWGGDDAEAVADAERDIPREVRHRDRLVTAQDFVDIARRTPGVDMGRVEVIPLYDPIEGLPGVPGVVTLVVVPAYDPFSPDAPRPDRFFLDTVCRHLEPRRLVTTELHVRGPEYRDIYVSAGVQVVSGYAPGPVIEAVKAELRLFLAPLMGGRDREGWPLGASVLRRELETVVARVDGVQLVNGLLVDKQGGASADEVRLGRLELPRLAAVEVTPGQPVRLEDLVRPAPPDGVRRVPIPVIPSRC